MVTQKICPYPGLRPFNEEESIYFKGREEHIHKIITQLQEKKFLMVTGASGDGKSSLIYAGLNPRARAGFFKARFNNWIIADFRPEREPVTNLARVLSRHLGYNNIKGVEDELSYGFSSLVKLYKESSHYFDASAADHQRLSDDEKLAVKNKGSNILLLVDQFEELFTNAENFTSGRPSVQAATLINLIIETTKLAVEENLPIYIVCTMRSDYIGDCAAFKGLPEHIVYSQFFVPRLKRQEIHKAILEPAKLSGNRINNRLIEKIINELSDGQDQLPILQHALNRIWRSHVEEGAAEMDLIHYAKVGGLNPELLPDDQKKAFSEWLSQQPEKRRKALEDPSILNILNAHARELFDYSCDRYRKQAGATVTHEMAVKTLKRIFTCLTKINDNRAVRNRITVQEIKQILGGELGLNNTIIEELLNPFRHPANTLIKPFITADPRSEKLKDEDLLDITHESLIRNWTELIEWTKQDHENVQVLNDFKKQLERWETNGRSKDHLLTIGSLSYFNSWHINLSPNPYLIAKYDESALSYSEKFSHSTKLLSSANDFLDQSNKAIRQKRRTVMAAAATVLLVLLSFTTWAILERNTAIEQQELALIKTMEANRSREDALHAKKISELSKEEALRAREEALMNEHFAIGAKKLAEISARDALAQKNIAMQASQYAENQAKVAQQEMLRANKEMENAKTQKQLAEEASVKATQSEKKAKDLSLKALSQQLAYKSTEKFDDPQISGVLAIQAYKYHEEAVKNALDPVVYQGLVNAKKEIGGDSSFCFSGTTAKEQKLLIELHNNALLSLGNDGTINFWDIASRRLRLSDNIIAKKKLSLNYYFYDEESYSIFVGFDNGAAGLYEIGPDKSVKNLLFVKDLKGLLRGGSYRKSSGEVDLITKNGDIITMNINNPKIMKRQSLNKKVSSFCKFSDQYVYVGTTDGDVIRVSSTGETMTMLEFPNNAVTALQLDSRNNKLFAGTSSGNIKEYFFNYDKWYEVNDYRVSASPISRIDYDFRLKKCLASSADKKITIIDYASPHSKPTFVNTEELYIRSMLVSNEGKIFCCTSDNRLREYHTDMAAMASDLGRYVTRDMTPAEWNRYVGSEVEYKTLKSTP
jgi:hypothetical protein